MKPLITKGPIAGGTIRATFVMGLYALTQASTLLLVARMLGPDRFGAFAGVASLAVLLGTISTFGTNIVLLGEVANDPSRRDEVLPYAIPTTLTCGAILLFAYLAICTVVLSITQVAPAALLTIGITELWLQPLFSLVVSEYHGLGRIARSQLLKTLPLMLRLVTAAAISMIHVSDPLRAYAYAYPVLSLLALVIALRTTLTVWPAVAQWRRPRIAELRRAAGYAALAATASGPGELDKTIATKLLALPAAGIYSAGARAIVATTMPVNAMLIAALPTLFREGNQQLGHLKRLLTRIFGVTLGYTLVAAIILWVCAPVFDWIFGAKYDGLSHTIRWLCLTIPGLALRMAAGTVMMAVGRPWARVGFEVTGLAVLVVSSAVLTARFGALGMPLALACSEWSMAALGITTLFAFTIVPQERK